MPGRVHRLILHRGDGKELRELHTIGDCDVCILGDDTAMLYREEWKLTLQGADFATISHRCICIDLRLWKRWATERLLIR